MEDFNTMEDFNVPSTERVALLQQLQDAMGGGPPYFWAACQVCDLKSLEDLIQMARINPDAVSLVATSLFNMVLHWSRHYKGIPPITTLRKPELITVSKTIELSSTSPVVDSEDAVTPPYKKQKTGDSLQDMAAVLPKLYKSAIAADMAQKRDKQICVVTGGPIVEVAHIYPFYALSNMEDDTYGERHSFWMALRIFWPKVKTAAWEAELFPGGLHEFGVERVYNLVTLTLDTHSMWIRGARICS